jgi:hypothetical protein
MLLSRSVATTAVASTTLQIHAMYDATAYQHVMLCEKCLTYQNAAPPSVQYRRHFAEPQVIDILKLHLEVKLVI